MTRTKKPNVRTSSDGTRFVTVSVKLPQELYERLERVVREEDTDRSKFTRRALANRLDQLGAAA